MIVPNGIPKTISISHDLVPSAHTRGSPMIGQQRVAVKSRGKGDSYLHDAEPEVYPELLPDSRG